MVRILLLDGAQKVFSAVRDPQSAIETQELDVAAQLDYSVANTKSNWTRTSSAAYVAVPLPDDTHNRYHLFAIKGTKTSGSSLAVSGIEEAFDDLDGYGYLTDHRMKGKALADIAGVIFSGTRWTVGACPALTGDLNMYYISRLEAFQNFISTFDLEAEFVYTITNNSVTARTVNIYPQVGTRTHRRFVYGTNALTVDREEARTGVYTAIVGRGKGVETTDDNDDPTGGYGRRLTLEDAEWSTARGDPVDKPKGQERLELPAATKAYGYPDGTPRTLIQTFEDDEDVATLIQDSYDALVAVSRPLVQFSATIAQLGYKAHLGDTVIIVRHDVGMVYETRITKLARDLLNDNKTEATLGDQLVATQSDRETAIRDEMAAAGKHLGTLYDQLKADADARFAAADKVAAKLQDDLTADRDYIDQKADDLAASLGTYKGEVDKAFKEYNDGFEASLTAINGKYVDTIASLNGLQTKVGDLSKDTSTRFTQLDDALQLYAKSKDVTAAIDVSAKAVQAAIEDSVSGKLTAFGATLDGLQEQVSDPTTGLKALITTTADTWNNKLTDAQKSLTAQITSSVKDGLASIDLKASGGYISLTGDSTGKSQVWMGGENLYLTGATHVSGDFFLTGLNNQLQTLQLTADGFFVTDDKGSPVGHIHTNQEEKVPGAFGLEFDLDWEGDYMSWAAQDEKDGLYMGKLSWYRPAVAAALKAPAGFVFDDQVTFKDLIHVDGAGKALAFGVNTFNNVNYSYFGGESMTAGFAYGTTATYLISGENYFNLVPIVKAWTGIGTIFVPTKINSNGTVETWVQVKI